MPFEAGGLADKLGNRYEGRWIASQLLSLLDEKIESVTVEAIGDDEQGVDLWVQSRDGIRQAYQCKARNASKESWTIGDLNHRGILKKLQFQLDQGANHAFFLVSSIGFTVLKDICEFARRSDNNPELFYKHKIQEASTEVQSCFVKFCKYLSLDADSEPDRRRAFNYLKRSYICVYPDDQITWQNLLDRVSYLLVGNPETNIAELLTYAENNNRFGSPIYADDLRKHLAEHGIHPKRLEHDSRIVPVIEELQNQFDSSIRPLLINGSLLKRNETSALIDAIENSNHVLLSGSAGYGKSGILFELTEYLKKKNIPYLPIRLDRKEPKNTAAQFGQKIGLPDCPAFALKSISGERKCVLILDQLDAIRWTNTHTNSALDVCKEIVRHVQTFRLSGSDIVVVLSVRNFDLEHDPLIKNWLTGKTVENFTNISINELPAETIKNIVGDLFSQMTQKVQSLLASPQNLSIWVQLKRTGTIPVFHSATQLIREFWKNRRRVLEDEAKITPDQIDQVLSPLIDYMEKKGKVSAPVRIVDLRPRIKDALFSYGILQENAGMISFCHQRYLDYLIAERLLEELDDNDASAIIIWLGPKEKQTLMRREQLRQILVIVSEESQSDFLGFAKSLLQVEGVRFHIKHLVLEMLGAQEKITEELGDYCLSLFQNDFWQEHIIDTVFTNHPSYVLFLLNKGLVVQWLESQDQNKRYRALWLLRSVKDKIADKIAKVIEPYVVEGSPLNENILNILLTNRVFEDSEHIFQLRLKIARFGGVIDYVDWTGLCAKNPIGSIKIIEAIMSTWTIDKISSTARRKTRLEMWYDRDSTALTSVAKGNFLETWDLLIPHIERLTSFKYEPYDDRIIKWTDNRYSGDQQTEMAHGIVKLVIHAGLNMAINNPIALIERTFPLEDSISSIIQGILIETYSRLPNEYADIGIKWLLKDSARFIIGSGYREPVWQPVVRLIKALSPHCSEDLFRTMEETIYNYHDPDELKKAKSRLTYWKDGMYDHYWGEAQYFLLPALSEKRIKKSTKELIGVLNRKFSKYSIDRFILYGRSSGGLISSKLSPSLNRISDRSWLNIVKNNKISVDGNHKWIQVDSDNALEASIRQFSGSLETVAKKYPDRFARLALQFPEDVHYSYFSAILNGCALRKSDENIPMENRESWKPASIETVEALLDKFRAEEHIDSAMAFCRLIRSRAGEKWSDETIKRLLFYAQNHPDPEPDKLNVHCDKIATEASDILFQNTINCVRGVAAGAIQQLLWTDEGWLGKLRPGIESLVLDKHPVVRMAAAEMFLPIKMRIV